MFFWPFNMISIQIQILWSELPRVRPNFSHRSSLLVIRDIIVFLTFDDDFYSNSDSSIRITCGDTSFSHRWLQLVISDINVFLTFENDFHWNLASPMSITFRTIKFQPSVIPNVNVCLSFQHDFYRNSDSPMSITSCRINFQPSSTTISNFENERLFDLWTWSLSKFELCDVD